MIRVSLRSFAIAVAGLLSLGIVHGQRKAFSINAETPHGALLQQIGQENDAAKKLALLDEFAAKFAADAARKDELIYVYNLKQELHTKAQQWDQVIDTGAKTIALDPDYLEVAVATLKAAEAKKDQPLVKQWATKTSEIARRSVGTAKREGEDDEAAKARLDYAKQVDTYADYALFNQAIQPGNPATTVEFAEALKAQSPASQYWDQVAPSYVLALNQQNQPAKAVAAAEEILAKDASNDDLLLLVSNHYFNQKPDASTQAKVLNYTGKAIAGWETRKKPDAIADADWEKKKAASLGISLWMNGMTYAAQNKLAESDKSLRAALPMVTNDQMKALAAFNLGLANFKTGEATKNKVKLTEAAGFFRQCAAIKSPVQGQAATNLKVIQTKYGIK